MEWVFRRPLSQRLVGQQQQRHHPFSRGLHALLRGYPKSCCGLAIPGRVWGFPGGSVGKESACNQEMQETRFNPLVRKTPWRRAWQPTPVFLPGESQGQRSLAGCSPRGRKQLDRTEHARTHAQEGLTEFSVPLCGAGIGTHRPASLVWPEGVPFKLG